MVRQELKFESNGKEKFALLILTLITRHRIAPTSHVERQQRFQFRNTDNSKHMQLTRITSFWRLGLQTCTCMFFTGRCDKSVPEPQIDATYWRNSHVDIS